MTVCTQCRKRRGKIDCEGNGCRCGCTYDGMTGIKKVYSWNGTSMTLSQLAKIAGLTFSTLHKRLKTMTLEDALFTPLMRKRRLPPNE